jgi:hypothetical protein
MFNAIALTTVGPAPFQSAKTPSSPRTQLDQLMGFHLFICSFSFVGVGVGVGEDKVQVAMQSYNNNFNSSFKSHLIFRRTK